MEFLEVVKRFLEVSDEVVGSLRLNHYIVDIGLNVMPYLLSKAMLYGPLISGTDVFEPEGHCGVAISVERCDERSLNLVILL